MDRSPRRTFLRLAATIGTVGLSGCLGVNPLRSNEETRPKQTESNEETRPQRTEQREKSPPQTTEGTKSKENFSIDGFPNSTPQYEIQRLFPNSGFAISGAGYDYLSNSPSFNGNLIINGVFSETNKGTIRSGISAFETIEGATSYLDQVDTERSLENFDSDVGDVYVLGLSPTPPHNEDIDLTVGLNRQDNVILEFAIPSDEYSDPATSLISQINDGGGRKRFGQAGIYPKVVELAEFYESNVNYHLVTEDWNKLDSFAIPFDSVDVGRVERLIESEFSTAVEDSEVIRDVYYTNRDQHRSFKFRLEDLDFLIPPAKNTYNFYVDEDDINSEYVPGWQAKFFSFETTKLAVNNFMALLTTYSPDNPSPQYTWKKSVYRCGTFENSVFAEIANGDEVEAYFFLSNNCILSIMNSPNVSLENK